MAVAFEMRFEGATLEQYDRVIELMGFTPNGACANGGIFHWVAQTDDGIVVVDVWERDEQFNRFAEEQIGPLHAQVGVTAPPVITRYEVHSTLLSPSLAQASSDLPSNSLESGFPAAG